MIPQGLVWVNRGFVAKAGEHAQGNSHYIKQPSLNRFIPGQSTYEENGHLIAKQIDLTALEAHFKLSFLPFVIENSPESGMMTPEKHLGYAVQWFSMAAAWVLLVLALSRRNT